MSKIEIVKVFEVLKSIKVENNRNILNWFVDVQQLMAIKSGGKLLTNDLREELTTLFGKRIKTIQLENRTSIWILKYDDLTFNIYSAKNRGTDIEICNVEYDQVNDKKLENKIINFLTELNKLINQ